MGHEASEHSRLINRRQQGDLGEASAVEWFTRLGAVVFLPFGHSPDIDLVAELDGRPFRVQVKTSTQLHSTPRGHSRFTVALATSGGNQSWNRKVKRLDPAVIDILFVLVGDGRRWCIPTAALECKTAITLGGAKYSKYEIEAGSAIDSLVYEEASRLDCPTRLGEYPSGQRTAPVKRLAFAFRGSNPLSPISETKFERRLGKLGRAVINQKRRVTIPSRAAAEAGLRDGDEMSVRSDGYGRLFLERIEPLTTPAGPEPGEAA